MVMSDRRLSLSAPTLEASWQDTVAGGEEECERENHSCYNSHPPCNRSIDRSSEEVTTN